jgi:hypothetical protein
MRGELVTGYSINIFLLVLLVMIGLERWMNVVSDLQIFVLAVDGSLLSFRFFPLFNLTYFCSPYLAPSPFFSIAE